MPAIKMSAIKLIIASALGQAAGLRLDGYEEEAAYLEKLAKDAEKENARKDAVINAAKSYARAESEQWKLIVELEKYRLAEEKQV